ncbi:unnamed protein product, partial [marine sediment metagenome]
AYPSGVQQTGAETDGIVAEPMIAPAILGAGALIGRFLSLGALRAIFARYGVIALKWLAKWGSVGVLLGLITSDKDDDYQIRPPGKRRYTIGHNPRVRTLQKVS